MENLGFYPLTVILSYLSEIDGVCLLITKRQFARQILPLFRWKVNEGLVVVNDRKHRHRFKVSPVQGPVVLLQRLNTRRLGKRNRKNCNKNNNGVSSIQREQLITGMATTEIANLEWEQAEAKFREIGSKNEFSFPYLPPLELLRFLDQLPKSQDKSLGFLRNDGITLLVSYPRSGNTLLRTLFERTTGIVTGSDTRPDRSLSKALAEAHNLVGEGVTQRPKTCFVKTHWPERLGYRMFEGRRGILIVRNPFDAIDSYWNLNVTNTHTETVTDEVYERHMEMFEQLAQNEIRVWCDFHQFWLDKSRRENFPLLIIRFEDLIQQPRLAMAKVLQFFSGSTRLDSFWERRIYHATTMTEEYNTLGSYAPRTATRGVKSVGKSLLKQRYSQEMLQYFHSVAASKESEREGENLLKYFGYDIFDQNFPENFVSGNVKQFHSNEPAASVTYNNNSSTVRVNSGNLVRPKDCPFGRDMRNWRLQHTENDTKPFPRVPRFGI